jgi:hypothetical protein
MRTVIARVCALTIVVAAGLGVANPKGVSAATSDCTLNPQIDVASLPLSDSLSFKYGVSTTCSTVEQSISISVTLQLEPAGGQFTTVGSDDNTVNDAAADAWSGSYSQACVSGTQWYYTFTAGVSWTDGSGDSTGRYFRTGPNEVTCNLAL